MPLNAFGWSSEEDEKLVQSVRPHTFLYNVQDPSRKNILARESTWQGIAQGLDKPVEECKKRWRGLRDGYMRTKRRIGTMHKTQKCRVAIFEKLHFLDDSPLESAEENFVMDTTDDQQFHDEETIIGTEQQDVITDNQEYYEITLVDPQEPKPLIKIQPKTEPDTDHTELKKVMKKPCGRKKSTPMPRNIAPIKILPKPLQVNSPKVVKYFEDSKVPAQRSQTIDKLIEKMLKENTNEIDVFFRSMAASVKKLQPNLIPKVKMEVCNVIAKYEMQSFDKNLNI